VFLLALMIDSSAALPSAGKSGASGASNAGASRSNLLCAGLLGSSFLGNVLTVAPLPDTRESDPDTAIQFTRIWSDSQHATVGGQAPAVAHARPVVADARPVVAVVKLPIAFSPDDRQKFEKSGWKRREEGGGHAVSYCLEGGGHRDAAGSSTAQGMICVSEQEPATSNP